MLADAAAEEVGEAALPPGGESSGRKRMTVMRWQSQLFLVLQPLSSQRRGGFLPPTRIWAHTELHLRFKPAER